MCSLSLRAISLTVAVLYAWTAAPVADTARVLAVETMCGKSHWNFMSSVLRALTDAGHSVTVFTPFPEGDRENYTELDTSAGFPSTGDQDVTMMLKNFSDPYKFVRTFSTVSKWICKAIYDDDRLAAIMRDGGMGGLPFDVLIIEPVLGVDCVSHIAAALHLPAIYVIPSPMITFEEPKFTGYVSNPAYVSHLMARHAVPGTFVQRLSNIVLSVYTAVTINYNDWSEKTRDPRPYHLSPPVGPSIIFQNSHYITEAARPVPPNVIDVGGIHLRPAKSLPKDIKDFIEDSPHGVIYFTFGSTVKLSSLPDHVAKAFEEALAQVPQKVLWKYEGEIKHKQKNVMTRKWFPQREILLHPKVKLFISHGGISGVYEAVDAGVPVLGFPLFYDQPRNVENLVHNGMAISMDLLTVTKDSLLKAISELINDEKYTKKAKTNSALFKDRPMTPAQSVAYWTEYVIRRHGAPHLKYHSHNIAWYQYFLLDVTATVAAFVFFAVFAFCKLLNVAFMYVTNKSQVKIKSR
ncbi:UDP-glucuronosyl/UDP-glucosyltransferase [Cinara cedri]|uniref:UDP-glucuronosyltransferase n=1 Tax=Cinara cedri TaxID=506608 RepID=A0A5E4MXN4_9HEMI|nr:UDP-glucuronosyl/UDP-glucosyltransferase [Cinara cedri]